MKKVIVSIFATIIFINICNAQTLVNVFVKDGKIFVQYDNGKSKEIVSTGDNFVVAFSSAKNFVVYQRVDKKSKHKEKKGKNLTTNFLFASIT